MDKIKLSVPSLASADSKTQIKDPNDSVEFLGMEIYKCKPNKYSKRIPQKKINEILSDLNQYGNYQSVLKNGLDYHTFLNILHSKTLGYKAAYKGATNLNTFLKQFNNASQDLVNKLLVEILGENVFNSLDDDKKAFLRIKWTPFKEDV